MSDLIDRQAAIKIVDEIDIFCAGWRDYAIDRIKALPSAEPTHGRLIDADELYEKTAEWEAQALHLVEVHMHDEDPNEWRKWSTVLKERSAFKLDIADAPTVIEANKDGGK